MSAHHVAVASRALLRAATTTSKHCISEYQGRRAAGSEDPPRINAIIRNITALGTEHSLSSIISDIPALSDLQQPQ